ncbi:hypothetical protein J3R83DRAFT_1212 [Lanmaoa asiatica]|nr:hypothetical protein J3R83DRAFT_1212 [Lanmaoa asiatica]
MDTREWIDASTIGGNASQELKQSLVDLMSTEAKRNRARGTRGFEPEITSRVAWTEFSIVPKAEEPERPEGRVVGEITVQEGAVPVPNLFFFFVSQTALLDMLNGARTIHGACSALLIDKCVSDGYSPTLVEPSHTQLFDHAHRPSQPGNYG